MKIHSKNLFSFFVIFLFVIMSCRQGSRSGGQADYEGTGKPDEDVKNYNPPSQVYQGTDTMGSTDTVKRDTSQR
jgi:hypothetical protein